MAPFPDCGDVALLRQHEGFRWRAESLAEGCAVRLFERVSAICSFSMSMLGDRAPDGMRILSSATVQPQSEHPFLIEWVVVIG